jgi:hypothetical protein
MSLQRPLLGELVECCWSQILAHCAGSCVLTFSPAQEAHLERHLFHFALPEMYSVRKSLLS